MATVFGLGVNVILNRRKQSTIIERIVTKLENALNYITVPKYFYWTVIFIAEIICKK